MADDIEPKEPEGETKPEDDKAPEKPQEPAQEPVAPPVTKDANPTPPAPEVPAQPPADANAAVAEATKEAADAKAKAERLELELNRERTARKHGIPDELMGMLRADSMEADAKALSRYVTATSSALGSGGLDPTDADDPTAAGEALANKLFAKNRIF
ncbi:hypothetical protein [Streptomyces chrestomyceticus]|uniref:hypothetical protein n=1 Tax=Streptomyces chrestomyceticus TaxID=68185 RepID=UPI0037BCB0FA